MSTPYSKCNGLSLNIKLLWNRSHKFSWQYNEKCNAMTRTGNGCGKTESDNNNFSSNSLGNSIKSTHMDYNSYRSSRACRGAKPIWSYITRVNRYATLNCRNQSEALSLEPEFNQLLNRGFSQVSNIKLCYAVVDENTLKQQTRINTHKRHSHTHEQQLAKIQEVEWNNIIKQVQPANANKNECEEIHTHTMLENNTSSHSSLAKIHFTMVWCCALPIFTAPFGLPCL